MLSGVENQVIEEWKHTKSEQKNIKPTQLNSTALVWPTNAIEKRAQHNTTGRKVYGKNEKIIEINDIFLSELTASCWGWR